MYWILILVIFLSIALEYLLRISYKMKCDQVDLASISEF